MELRQLHYFTRIVALRSFTKAATELRIAQPALGQQVRHLEEELGVTLLVRHSRGVDPTEAGRLLMERAGRILEEVQRAKQDVRQLQNAVQGTVTVGMTAGISDLLAAPLVEWCNRECPQVDLNLVQDLSVRLIERVATEQEMAFVVASRFELAHARDIAAEPLANEQLYLVGAPALIPDEDGPMSFAELAQYRLIMLGTGKPGRSHGLRRLIEAEAQRQNIALTIAYEMQSVAAVKDLVERELGAAILPIGTVRRRVADGRLRARAIVHPKICREVCLAYSARRPLSPAARAVKTGVATLVAQVLATDEAALEPIPAS